MNIPQEYFDQVREYGKQYGFDGIELGGIILKNQGAIQLPNLHSDPAEHCLVDISGYPKSNILAFWHTHREHHLDTLSEDDYIYSQELGLPILMYKPSNESWDFYTPNASEESSNEPETMGAKIKSEDADRIREWCQGNDTNSDMEQGGWILHSQGAIECLNRSNDLTTYEPDYSYNFDDIIALWHSHPGGSEYSDLSSGDIDWADDFGKPIIMYHPRSDTFKWYDPTGELDSGTKSSSSLESSLTSSSTIPSELQSQITAQAQQNALLLLARLQKENERLGSEIQVEQSQINLNNQRSQFTEILVQIEAGTQENILQLAEITRSETQIELEQKLKLNQLKYGALWTLTASR